MHILGAVPEPQKYVNKLPFEPLSKVLCQISPLPLPGVKLQSGSTRNSVLGKGQSRDHRIYFGFGAPLKGSQGYIGPYMRANNVRNQAILGVFWALAENM